MSHAELRQEAIQVLSKAFQVPADVPAHIVQAAVSIVLSPEPKE